MRMPSQKGKSKAPHANKEKIKKIMIWVGIVLLAVVAVLAGAVWMATFHPKAFQKETVVCGRAAPVLKPGQPVRILCWNVQYMAGKNYVFYYDLLDGSGPDERPSPEDIALTLKETARVIRDENPDIVMLQEVDDGAKRTDYEDQLACLLALLPEDYSCHASAFYWKAAFVPHGRIMGAVGMKLSVISKYKIAEAARRQLALIPKDPVTKQFNLKRAVLETRLPIEGTGRAFAVMTTHLDAFAQGTDTMERQVGQVKGILDGLSKEGNPWVIGGDFNLLASANSYHRLPQEERAYFNPRSEIGPLLDAYESVPALGDIEGPEYGKWFTHFPNGPRSEGPDRTIDYIFLSEGIQITEKHVRQSDTLTISDHLPIVMSVTIP